MKTFLQVLRLVFWTNALQRALVCIGAAAIIVDSILLFFFGGFGLASPVNFSVTAMICLLMGGVYWRMAAASRIVQIAPYGRIRLLGVFLGMLLLVALVESVPNWLSYRHWMNPEFIPFITWYLLRVADFLLVASMAVIGMFMASRSPLAALVVLIVVLSPAFADTFINMRSPRHLPPLLVWAALLVLIWLPFSIWYLRARRISPPRWLVGSGQEVLATSLVSSARPRSRRQALERQLLGGTTVIHLSLVWFVVIGLLLAMQWVIVSLSEPDDSIVVGRVMNASLCLCPIVTTIVSFAAIRRSRALWLLTSSTRAEFFHCVERILVRLNLAMALVFAIWLAALWFMQSWRSGPAEDQLGLAFVQVIILWLAGLFAIYAQLAGWPRWLVATIVAGMLMCLWWITTLPVTTFSQQPATPLAATLLLMVVPVVGTALRWQALRRWREGDFPRVVTSMASGT
jgi:hypothetical protein